MRFHLLVLLALVTVFTSCDNNECSDVDLNIDATQLATDKAKIQEYLTQNNIVAQTHPSGISYVITREGDGARPNSCDDVSITYEGKLLSTGKVFHSSGSIKTWNLQDLITGWQIGVPLIKEGGRITLYIPSGYAYGERAVESIPANSVLIFEILLFGVN